MLIYSFSYTYKSTHYSQTAILLGKFQVFVVGFRNGEG